MYRIKINIIKIKKRNLYGFMYYNFFLTKRHCKVTKMHAKRNYMV